MKRSFVLVFFLVTLMAPAFQAKAAVTGLKFGGFARVVIPCTCPPFGFLITYGPFYNNSSIPTAGALYLPLKVRPYANFLPFVPTTVQLGSYIPGANACNIINPAAAVGGAPPCPGIPLPALGTIRSVATSFPGVVW
jgi:hypothetical protein